MSEECIYCGSGNVIDHEEHSSFCKDCRRSNVLGENESVSSHPDDIYIIGMGYVGTCLAAVLANEGLTVRGVDIDSEIVSRINEGDCPIAEDDITELFERYASEGTISATTSYDELERTSTILVTVGTPLSKQNPDLSAVKSASTQIGRHLSEDDVVIFRSTLPAGATEEIIRPILDEESGLVAGEDYSLAFCPERMAEGSAYEDLSTIPVIVGGLTDDCRSRVVSFWEGLGHDTVAVSSPRAAEVTKLADNWWIDLNIALANELALLSEKLGVDALEVIQAANTLPKGEHNVNILFPGSGVGGSCLVKDPWFVANLAEEFGLTLQTPRISRQINDQMPSHLVELTENSLDGFEGKSIAVLGYAFKKGTDDTRNTPAKDVVDELDTHQADIRITDPYVSADTIIDEVGHETYRLREAIDNVDAVVVVTGHQQYHDLTPDQLISYVGTDEFAVVDGRHVFESNAFEGTDVRYCGVGRVKNE